jgi:hypothetical protein
LFCLNRCSVYINAGVYGQYIDVEVTSHSSSCEYGYRAGLDVYDITGTVGPNVTHLFNSYWESSITVGVLRVGATDFSAVSMSTCVWVMLA